MGAKVKNLDFSKVKDRQFNTKFLPEGDYSAKVISVEDHESAAGNANWLFTIEITTPGRGKGASYPYYCPVDNVKSLWKVRNLATACGINVSKSKTKFDPNKLVGLECGISLEDDEYEGKPKSVISATLPLSEVGDAPEDAADDDIEEDQPKAKKDKKAKKGKKAKEDEELEIEDM